MHAAIFSPILFSLYFVAGGEICPGASIAALLQRVPGPSLSHYVPDTVLGISLK